MRAIQKYPFGCTGNVRIEYSVLGLIRTRTYPGLKHIRLYSILTSKKVGNWRRNFTLKQKIIFGQKKHSSMIHFGYNMIQNLIFWIMAPVSYLPTFNRQEGKRYTYVHMHLLYASVLTEICKTCPYSSIHIDMIFITYILLICPISLYSLRTMSI
jgi:hypothetical protein